MRKNNPFVVGGSRGSDIKARSSDHGFQYSEVMWNTEVQSSMRERDNRQRDRSGQTDTKYVGRWLDSSSPGIPYGRQGDVTIWAELQDAVLRLDPDPEELDVLRRVRAHTCVLLHTGGEEIKEIRMIDLKVITSNVLFQLFGHNPASYKL